MDYSEGFVDLTGEEEAGLYAVRDPSLEIPQLLRLKRVALTGPSGETIYISTQEALELARQSLLVQDFYAAGTTEDTFTFQTASSEFFLVLATIKTAQANPEIITEEWVLSPPLLEGTLPFLEAYAVHQTIIDVVLARSVAKKLESSLGIDDTMIRLALTSCDFPQALWMTRTNAMEIMRSRLDASIPQSSKRLLLTPHQARQIAPLFKKGVLPLPSGFLPDDVDGDLFPRAYCNKMSIEYMTDNLKCFRLIDGLEGVDTLRAIFQRSAFTPALENKFICAVPWVWGGTPFELRVARDKEGCWQLYALEDRQQRLTEMEDEGAVGSDIETLETTPLKKIILFSSPGTGFLPHPPSDYWVPREAPDGSVGQQPLQFGEFNSGLHVCLHPPLATRPKNVENSLIGVEFNKLGILL